MDEYPQSDFSFQPTLKGESISIRPLHEEDFEELYACASDKKIWEGHPSPERYKLSEFKTYFKSSIASQANVVVMEKQTSKIIGTSRYYQVDKHPNDICIGFTFLVRDYWGGITNSELKTLMIDYAFRYFPVVWLHVGEENIRSKKATLKIGGKFDGKDKLMIGGRTGEWLCYKISKADWFDQKNLSH